jgi:hypothetical protein
LPWALFLFSFLLYAVYSTILTRAPVWGPTPSLALPGTEHIQKNWRINASIFHSV